jgi:hypothetical protein
LADEESFIYEGTLFPLAAFQISFDYPRELEPKYSSVAVVSGSISVHIVLTNSGLLRHAPSE